MDSPNLDPEPFSCYGVYITNRATGSYERREKTRHEMCHEGDVHFNPRPQYEQNEDLYPDWIWDDE